MALKYNQNAILTGYIDAICLVCETVVSGDDEATRHINTRSHIKNFTSTQLVEKFKDDQILKVKKGYYCICCNSIFPTLTKVGLHVVETDHKNHKGSNKLQRTSSLIKFGDVVIDEKAWQGLVGDMCSVCNTEFNDETVHLADFLHSINLVKSRVQFDEGQIYRKVDDSTFQCLTCNSVLLLKDIVKHFESSEHKKTLLKQTNDIKFEAVQKPLLNGKTKVEPIIENVNDKSSCSDSSCYEDVSSTDGSEDELVSEVIEKPNKEYNTSNILESVTIFEKSEVNINFERETAFCKKCLGNIDFDFKSIENHIEEHKRNPTKRDVGYVAFPCEADTRTPKPKVDIKPFLPAITVTSTETTDSENATVLDNNHNVIASKPEKTEASKTEENANPAKESPAEFARRNSLTYNLDNNNAYCRLCLTRVPSSLRSMQEHVAGNGHKKKVSVNEASSSAAPKTRAIRKMPTEDYFDEVFNINSMFQSALKVVNEKFCIGATSFNLITVNGDRLRCQVCEMFISRLEMSSHIESCYHERLFNRVPVVWSIAKEFVREVRPGIFHCGYCNMMEASLESLETHFQSAEHKDKRSVGEDTLARHRPAIAEYKKRRDLEIFARMMLASRYRF